MKRVISNEGVDVDDDPSYLAKCEKPEVLWWWGLTHLAASNWQRAQRTPSDTPPDIKLAIMPISSIPYNPKVFSICL